MRKHVPFLLGFFTAVAVTAAAPSVRAADEDDPKWCRTCHDEPVFGMEGFGRSVHADLSCQDCHEGYTFNPHEKVEAVDLDEYKVYVERGSRAPVALAACLNCHDEVTETPGYVPHRMGGPKAEGEEPAEGVAEAAIEKGLPYCLDCHGDPHLIPKYELLEPHARRQMHNEHCISCHGNEEKMSARDYATTPVETYEHSMHGRKLALGSDTAPGCPDCHGSHDRMDLHVPTIAAERCSKCHEGVDAKFATLVSHRPVDKAKRPIAFYTQRFFGWLTFLTILFLVTHVLLDLNATIREGMRGGKHKGGKE
jgi:hypothetical protein